MTSDPIAALFLLVQRLYTRTREGRVNWQPTRADGIVIAPFHDYTVVMQERPDPDYPDAPDFVLEIRDQENRRVEQVSNRALMEQFQHERTDGMNPYQLLQRLHQLAVRAALGSDRALGSILDQLE